MARTNENGATYAPWEHPPVSAPTATTNPWEQPAYQGGNYYAPAKKKPQWRAPLYAGQFPETNPLASPFGPANYGPQPQPQSWNAPLYAGQVPENNPMASPIATWINPWNQPVQMTGTGTGFGTTTPPAKKKPLFGHLRGRVPSNQLPSGGRTRTYGLPTFPTPSVLPMPEGPTDNSWYGGGGSGGWGGGGGGGGRYGRGGNNWVSSLYSLNVNR